MDLITQYHLTKLKKKQPYGGLESKEIIRFFDYLSANPQVSDDSIFYHLGSLTSGVKRYDIYFTFNFYTDNTIGVSAFGFFRAHKYFEKATPLDDHLELIHFFTSLRDLRLGINKDAIKLKDLGISDEIKKGTSSYYLAKKMLKISKKAFLNMIKKNERLVHSEKLFEKIDNLLLELTNKLHTEKRYQEQIETKEQALNKKIDRKLAVLDDLEKRLKTTLNEAETIRQENETTRKIIEDRADQIERIGNSLRDYFGTVKAQNDQLLSGSPNTPNQQDTLNDMLALVERLKKP